MALLRRDVQETPVVKRPRALPIAIVFWHDVLVVLDNGRATPSHYQTLGDHVFARCKDYPKVGMLCVIAADAIPPADDARRALNLAITRVEGSLQCICWLVEGDGFQGAMVRAVLTGIRLFGRQTYPTHVASEMTEGLAWVLRQLDDGPKRAALVGRAVMEIQAQRTTGRFDAIF